MPADAPLISIVIPTRDRAALLRETLNSIFGQTYLNWEAMVIDDHSKDQTAEQMRSLVANESRVQYLSMAEKSSAPPAARNIGVANARGRVVIFLDSDDLLAPPCLAQRIEFMRDRAANLDFAVFPCQLFRQTPGDVALLWNRKTDEDDLDRFLKMDVAWQTTSPIWRRESLAKFSPWDEEVLSGQDWEFHIRELVAGLKYEWPECNRRAGFSPHGLSTDEDMRAEARTPIEQIADCSGVSPTQRRDSIGKQSFGPQHIRGSS